MADASEEGLALTPPAEDPVSPDDQLDNAAASALDEPAAVTGDAPVAFGREWVFDYDQRRFVRGLDGAPLEARGTEGLRTWLGGVVHTARGAHRVFSDEHGMDKPNAPIGQAGADAVEHASDWGEKLRDAVMVHDRVTGVSNFDGYYDPDQGGVFATWDLTTDAEETLRFEDLALGRFDG
jgi:hypothetical protein